MMPAHQVRAAAINIRTIARPVPRPRSAGHRPLPGDDDDPADPRALVAMRLRHFLDATGDVNYAAQLVDAQVGNTSAGNAVRKRVFADAALEAKPAQWKMAFRAGKPATEAARAFAQKWLADLKSQGVQ